ANARCMERGSRTLKCPNARGRSDHFTTEAQRSHRDHREESCLLSVSSLCLCGERFSEKFMIDPIQLARQLIDIPSPTDSERAISEVLTHDLDALGYAVRRHDVAENRFNVFASAGGKPRVVINSHIDTVTP